MYFQESNCSVNTIKLLHD